MTEDSSKDRGADVSPAAPWDHPRGLGRELWRRHDLSGAARAIRSGGPTARMLRRLRLARGRQLAGLLQRRGFAPLEYAGFPDLPLFDFHFPYQPFDPGPGPGPVPGRPGYPEPGRYSPGGSKQQPTRETGSTRTLQRKMAATGQITPTGDAISRGRPQTPHADAPGLPPQILWRSVADHGSPPRHRAVAPPLTTAGRSKKPVAAEGAQLWRPLRISPTGKHTSNVISKKVLPRPSPLSTRSRIVPSRASEGSKAPPALQRTTADGASSLYQRALKRSQGILRATLTLPATSYPVMRRLSMKWTRYPVAPLVQRKPLTSVASASATPDGRAGDAVLEVGEPSARPGSAGRKPVLGDSGPAAWIPSPTALLTLRSSPYVPWTVVARFEPGRPMASATAADQSVTPKAQIAGASDGSTDLYGPQTAKHLPLSGGSRASTTMVHTKVDRLTIQPLPSTPPPSPGGAEIQGASHINAAPAASEPLLHRGIARTTTAFPKRVTQNRTAALHEPLRLSAALRPPLKKDQAASAEPSGRIPPVESPLLLAVLSPSMDPAHHHWLRREPQPGVIRSAAGATETTPLIKQPLGADTLQRRHSYPILEPSRRVPPPAAITVAAAGTVRRTPFGNGAKHQSASNALSRFHPETSPKPHHTGAAAVSTGPVLNQAPPHPAIIRRSVAEETRGNTREAISPPPVRLLRRFPVSGAHSAPTADYAFHGLLLRASIPRRHAPQAREGTDEYHPTTTSFPSSAVTGTGPGPIPHQAPPHAITIRRSGAGETAGSTADAVAPPLERPQRRISLGRERNTSIADYAFRGLLLRTPIPRRDAPPALEGAGPHHPTTPFLSGAVAGAGTGLILHQAPSHSAATIRRSGADETAGNTADTIAPPPERLQRRIPLGRERNTSIADYAFRGLLLRTPIPRRHSPWAPGGAGRHDPTTLFRSGAASVRLSMHGAMPHAATEPHPRTRATPGNTVDAIASPGRLLQRTPLSWARSVTTAVYPFRGRLLRASGPQWHRPQVTGFTTGSAPVWHHNEFAATLLHRTRGMDSPDTRSDLSATDRITRAPQQLRVPPPPLPLPDTHSLRRAGNAMGRGSTAASALFTGAQPDIPIVSAAPNTTSAVLRFPAGAAGYPALQRTPFRPPLPRLVGQEAAAIPADLEAGLPLAVPALSARQGGADASPLLQRQQTATVSAPTREIEEVPEQASQESGGTTSGPGLDALADKVWRKLIRRLTTERERRGLLPWG